MSSLSFATATKAPSLLGSAVARPPARVSYDPDLTYAIASYDATRKCLNSEFNISALLGALREDRIDDLRKITVIGQPCSVPGHVNQWDIVYNSPLKTGFTACVYFARARYQPIAERNLLYRSPTMSTRREITRLNLNALRVGDHCAVAVFDSQDASGYVLIFKIDDIFNRMVPVGNPAQEQMLPVMNLSLTMAVRDHDEGYVEIPVVEESEDLYPTKRALLVRLLSTIYKADKPVLWQPLFSATTLGNGQAQAALSLLEEATTVSMAYEAVVVAFRDAYDARGEKLRGLNKEERKKSGVEPVQAIIRCNSEAGTITVMIAPTYNPEKTAMVFAVSELEGEDSLETVFSLPPAEIERGGSARFSLCDQGWLRVVQFHP